MKIGIGSKLMLLREEGNVNYRITDIYFEISKHGSWDFMVALTADLTGVVHQLPSEMVLEVLKKGDLCPIEVDSQELCEALDEFRKAQERYYKLAGF